MAQSLATLTVHICATAQNSDLDATGFGGLTYVQINNVGSVGEFGSSPNILTYDELGDTVVQKSKGLTNAGDPQLEVARNMDDTGQDHLRTAAAHATNAYAFKFVYPDGDIAYNRAVVGGPVRPNGRSEDFDLEVYTLGFTQAEVFVEA